MRTGEDPRADVALGEQHVPGFAVLGRLLWAGLLAGFAIGGVTMVVAGGPEDVLLALGYAPVAAMVGLVAGLAVQVLNASVLHIARALRPEMRPAAMRLVLLPLPVLGAMLAPYVILSSGGGWGAVTALGWVGVLVAGGLGAVAVWVAAPWCLAPLTTPGPARAG
ncbi:hypothetical protein J4G33_09670 [Actinotalea sp. BY-33]|uniref:Uncharacterized protein n=1 Tax=Actinotalea soli TaxID=2819234 RepID=A0A939LSU8_9CELL|nr:hypothetical protein [Actinotalea soli]MBO1752070.1 hypothetical protein [Actinotalea soli]